MSVSSHSVPGEAAPIPSVGPFEKLLTGIGLTIAIGLLAATLPAGAPPLAHQSPLPIDYSSPK